MNLHVACVSFCIGNDGESESRATVSRSASAAASMRFD